jgi:2-polyprenyl-6-hydroxyphenyl methylase/3-demethylubiquinone-9 3-methyltransferase
MSNTAANRTEQGTNSNVDAAEIAKFEALASRWWDKESEFKPLHDINPLRANFIDELAHLAGKKVLDVGCGGGILSESMAQRGAEVTGIDMGEAPLSVAKLHALESGVAVNYQRIEVETLAAEQPASFDVVTCLEMLEHVPDPASVVKACFELVKPGGHVFFSTINRNPKAYLFAIVGAEYVLRLLPAGTHDYHKFIKPSELAHWCREAGLDVTKMTGMTYNPLTKVYKLDESDVSVNYLMASQRPAQ